MAAKKQEHFRVGVIGYSSAFNMGQLHLTSMAKNEGVEVAAVCELDPERRQVAEEDFPGIKTYSRVGTMLRNANLDLVTIITPAQHARQASGAVPQRRGPRSLREAPRHYQCRSQAHTGGG